MGTHVLQFPLPTAQTTPSDAQGGILSPPDTFHFHFCTGSSASVWCPFPKIFRHQVGVVWVQTVTLCVPSTPAPDPRLTPSITSHAQCQFTTNQVRGKILEILGRRRCGEAEFGLFSKVSKKKLKKIISPVKKLVILNRRQMLHIPEQCCPLFTALIVLNELEPWK